MKTPASLPGGRKPQGFSNPQLVAMRRDYFRRLAKAKLLNTPDAPAVEAYLKRLDEELARRKITIQDPELNLHGTAKTGEHPETIDHSPDR